MNTWKQLGYLGLAPFGISLYFSVNELWFEYAQTAFIAYSAVIASFLAGTLWQVKQDNKGSNKFTLISSNVFCLIAFSALLMKADIALGMLAMTYILLFAFETTRFTQQKIHHEYKVMRLTLTVIVIVMHIAAFLLW